MDLSNVHGGRFMLAWLATVVIIAVTDIVIHGMVLAQAYQVHYPFAREATEMPILPGVVKWLVWSFLFVWIYTFGLHPGRPHWLQGLTYGFLMGLFFWVPVSLVDYSVLPIPPFFIPAWILLGTGQLMLAGLALGFIYRTRADTLMRGEA